MTKQQRDYTVSMQPRAMRLVSSTTAARAPVCRGTHNRSNDGNSQGRDFASVSGRPFGDAAEGLVCSFGSPYNTSCIWSASKEQTPAGPFSCRVPTSKPAETACSAKSAASSPHTNFGEKHCMDSTQMYSFSLSHVRQNTSFFRCSAKDRFNPPRISIYSDSGGCIRCSSSSMGF